MDEAESGMDRIKSQWVRREKALIKRRPSSSILVLGEDLLQQSLMTQLSETILACVYFCIQDGLQHIDLFHGEPRII